MALARAALDSSFATAASSLAVGKAATMVVQPSMSASSSMSAGVVRQERRCGVASRRSRKSAAMAATREDLGGEEGALKQ